MTGFKSSLNIDASYGGAVTLGRWWTISHGSTYLSTFIEIGYWQEALSIVLPGYRFYFADLKYLKLDFGVKPMFPIYRNVNLTVFLSPNVGIGWQIRNLDYSNSDGNNYNSELPSFDSNLGFFFGGSLDFLISESISTSLELKYTNSKFFLDTNSFSIPEFRLIIGFTNLL